MKLTNKKLALLLGILALLFFGTKYLKSNNTQNKLNTDLISIQKDEVSKIEIDNATSENTLVFTKNSDAWEVSNGVINSSVKTNTINTLLNTLEKIKVERLVAKSKDKWKTYELSDSTATKVRITQNGDITDLYLGKIKFNASANQYQYDQRNISGSTYFRTANSPNIYLTEGMLSSTFNRGFNSWRNTDFSNFKEEDITQLKFEYKDKEYFSIIKKDSIWKISNQIIENEKILKYLNQINYKSNSNFADDFIANSDPDYKLIIEGKNMETLKIESYEDLAVGKFYLKSSENPSAFFESDSTGIQNDFFVNSNYFNETKL